MLPLTLRQLRGYAVVRSLFPPTTLARAMDQLGFVQADPIRAPARAQDLMLRHRVADYHAGDLERQYPELLVEEDYFVNYGFLPRRHLALMHPRTPRRAWDRSTRKRAALILEFVQARGEAHPREVDAHFAHGTVTNYWGGSSNATTHLLDGMHYRGLLRVARREAGVRVYAPRAETTAGGDESPEVRARALLELAVTNYAPMPLASLGKLASRLRLGAPQLGTAVRIALKRARTDYPHTRVDGIDWYWPPGEAPGAMPEEPRVRFLAPFDPVVWDRQRFELFWGWAYRFEAYTPVPKRKLGYCALPILWKEQVIGWGNLEVEEGVLQASTTTGC